MNNTKVEADVLPVFLASAKRLVKLIELQAPVALICSEIALLARRATVMWGAMVWQQIGQQLTTDCRHCVQRCIYCGAETPPTADMCEACDHKMEQEYGENQSDG